MEAYHETEFGKLYLGDCLDVMREMADSSIDAIVTDPPYGLAFMGKKWDYDVPSLAIWEECLRVLKPGGHLLAFAGTRTQHRMATRIEDAGFEIRDMVAWVYGSGFPKSFDIGKAVDKINGNKSNEFSGLGTALKPAFEPITIARKPLSEKTIVANVLKHSTGGLNIDGCRVETDDALSFGSRELGDGIKYGKCKPTTEGKQNALGRFPANFIHDGSDDVLDLFPHTKSGALNSGHKRGKTEFYGGGTIEKDYGNDSGSAARFFYCAKASKSERNAGCDELPDKTWKDQGYRDNDSSHLSQRAGAGRNSSSKNHHPTVKPIAVMEYLIKLVTRRGQVVFDPFGGSGTTGIAAFRQDRRFIISEMDESYCEIAAKRIQNELDQLTLL